MQSDMYDYVEFLREFPGQAKKVLTRLGEEGELTVRIDSAQLLDIRRELDRRTDTRILGTLMLSALAGTMLLYYFGHAGDVSQAVRERRLRPLYHPAHMVSRQT